jgi:opacity protein-like surface antigen
MKNIASMALSALVLTASANLAMAQDEDPFDSDFDSEAEPESTTPEPQATTSTESASAGGPTMGISTVFPTGGDGAAANLLWGLDTETFLNIRFGFDFEKGAVPDPMNPGMTTDETRVGTFVGVGYRMYKPTEGRIRPYLEPGGFIAIDDFSNAGDTMALGFEAVLGVDFALMDQFTLGMGIGGALTFSDSFDTIDLGLFTQSINATFWW